MIEANPMTDEQLLELIREAHPLGEAAPGSEEAETDRLVRRVLSADLERPPSNPGRRLPTLGSRRTRLAALLAGTLGAAGAVVAAILLLTLGGSPGVAFAGWSTSPTPPASGQLRSAEATCGKLDPRLAHLTPTVADTRGPFTMLVYAQGNVVRSCIGRRRGEGAPAASLGSTRSRLKVSPVAAGAIGWRQVTGIAPGTDAPGEPPASFVDGQAGEDVTAVTLELEDGRSVQATVAGGWFAAWWPGNARVKVAKVTTPNGTSTQPPRRSMTVPPEHATPSGTNASGETYGSSADATRSTEPDLIAAIGVGPNGVRVTGYVRASELQAATGGNVHTPQEAANWMRSLAHRAAVHLPLLARDGTTVIGTFTIPAASGARPHGGK